MEDSKVYGYCPDGTPITSEIGQEISDVLHAIGWIGVIASPRLWASLRRTPPKAFLLNLIDAYLVYASSGRYYVNVPEGQPPPDLTLRRAPTERLRNLLVAWEPSVISPDIRDAALAVALAEFGGALPLKIGMNQKTIYQASRSKPPWPGPRENGTRMHSIRRALITNRCRAHNDRSGTSTREIA